MESPKIGVAVRREAVHPVRDPYVALSLQKEGSRGVPEGQNIWKVTSHPSSFLVSRLSLNPAFLLLFLRVITGQKVITRWKVVHWR